VYGFSGGAVPCALNAVTRLQSSLAAAAAAASSQSIIIGVCRASYYQSAPVGGSALVGLLKCCSRLVQLQTNMYGNMPGLQVYQHASKVFPPPQRVRRGCRCQKVWLTRNDYYHCYLACQQVWGLTVVHAVAFAPAVGSWHTVYRCWHATNITHIACCVQNSWTGKGCKWGAAPAMFATGTP
jgi:hypothetical protein